MKMRAKKQHIVRSDKLSHRLFDYRRSVLRGRTLIDNNFHRILFQD